MKKRIIIVLLMCLLITTGCTCEYNLKINNNTYQEEVIITASDSTERTELNQTFKIPVDKEIYDCSGDADGNNYGDNAVYNYSLNGNRLVFNYDFNSSEYTKSTAAYQCYNTVTITKRGKNTIVSTSNKVDCFDTYQALTNLTIKVTVDQNVISHNADSVSGNTYIWNLDRVNAKSKAVNMILGEASSPSTSSITPSSSNSGNNSPVNPTKKDYSLYILCGVLLVLTLIGYLVYKIIKKNENNLDV